MPSALHSSTAPQTSHLTLLEVLQRATGYLNKHGSDSPRLDAEVLMAHALGLRRLDLYVQFERPLKEAELTIYRELIARRAKHAPVAYLVGHKEFMGLDFEVTPAVLIPNPDTEVLVQRAVAIARELDGPMRAADVGTGSGCIGIALARYAPAVDVWAGDISAEALAVAARNVEKHGLADRVHLLEGDLLDPLPGDFDLICANLPYVSSGADLPADVRAQPAAALYAGEGGAAVIKRLVEQAPSRMNPGGRLLLEVDPSVADAVTVPFANRTAHRDLAGHVRVLELWS